MEHPSGIAIFAGGSFPDVCAMIKVFAHTSGNVIVQTPLFNSLLVGVTRNKRYTIENRLIYKKGRHSMDFDDLETPAKSAKLVILCCPYNPIGRVWTYNDLQGI